MSAQPQGIPSDIPKRWPLVAQPENRSSSPLKDSRLVNAYAEKTKDGYEVEKRPGSSIFEIVNLPGNGMYSWLSGTGPGGALIAAYGGAIYGYSPNHLGPVPPSFGPIGTIDTTRVGNYASFIEIPSVPPVLMLGYGPKAYVLSAASGLVLISDLNYPTGGVVPGFVYLDGTVYIMTADGSIWGSATLDDPTTWDPLNVLVAQTDADVGVALAKQLVYVVAMKSTTTEFFYDAGNTSGSPLAPVPGALLNYGCLSADTVQEIDGVLFWVTSSATVSPQVIMLENLQHKIISTPAIDRLLELAGAINPLVTTQLYFYSFAFKYAGHKFYGITHVGLNITVVFDINEHLWYQWTDANGNYFQIMSVTKNTSNALVMQEITSGNLCFIGADYEIPSDAGPTNGSSIVFPVDIYTPNFDAGVDRIKYLPVMRFNADQQTGGVLKVRHSDDDYKTWTNFRNVDLGRKRPRITQNGSFYRRAYHFRHYANTAFRIRSVDLQMGLGVL